MSSTVDTFGPRPSFSPQPFWTFSGQGILLLVFCVPLLVAGFLGTHALDLLEDREGAHTLQQLARHGENLILRSHPELFFQARCLALSRRLFHPGPHRNDLDYWVRRAKREWGVSFSAASFAPDGALKTIAHTDAAPAVSGFSPDFVQTCWDFLRGRPRIYGRDSSLIRDRLNEVFGVNFELHRLEKRRQQMFPIRSPLGDGLIYWGKHPDSRFGGILCIIWTIPSDLERLRSHLRRQPPGERELYLVGNLGEIESLNPARLDLPTHLFLQQQFLFAKARSARGQGALWQAVDLGPDRLVIRQSDDPSGRRFAKGALWVFLGLGCFGVLWLGNQLQEKGTTYVPIRRKMLMIFLFALLFPLFEFMYLGHRALLIREQSLILNFQKTARDALFSLDNDFVREKNTFAGLARRLRDHPLMLSNPAALASVATVLRQQRQLTRFEVRGAAGELLALTDNLLSFRRNRDYIEVVAEMCMERHLGERRPPAPPQPDNQVKLVARMLLESPGMGVSGILERRDKVHELMIGHYHDFLYWDVFDRPDHPAAYVTLTQHMPFVFDQYLERRARESRRGPLRLLARKNETGKWFPSLFQAPPALQEFMLRLKATGQPTQERLLINGRPWQVVGIPGRNLEKRSLATLQPESRILAGLADLRGWLSYGSIATLLSMLCLSLIITEFFLKPVRHLEAGMRALQARNPDHRIPPGDPDELGDLAQTFRQLMGTLGEVNMARRIQENLFPREPLRTGPYHLHGITRPATQLGGDYFDFQMIGPDQLLVLVGDVTGHGMPAAILMSLAKSVVTSMASEQRFTADEIVAELNSIIFLSMKKQLFMTAVFFTVNTRTHEGRLFICGHPSPFHQGVDGGMKMLDAVGFVMGMRAKPIVTPIPFSLGPGERLFFYTDGLAESLENAVTENAFETLMRYAQARPRLDVEQATLDFLDHHPHVARGLPQPDDFTVVILERTV